ncbi:MAG: thiol peroxidase [Corynebacterium sp.]|uniref:thiol peroxidase n=1 Tax=unclassified Corynebacterium TaxID=2624378 RepID=UPI0026479039|nr:thiol peroxidase [Corynebacterium sp.]MDN5582877.1 thiol peroxidase [Corynebacterium sp.]MDN5720657.1 thiol peroxidase [Corynebacterium sp.]MDN6258652.1 thiol peroxidase [Corynebacterium sp.]MDN6388015.1 thiol peroxidase [Corynebacterium sp.]MDN6510125.1 thiol peroxidase [Corynebacterium sp.]
MADTAFQGTPAHTVGDLPAVGEQAPNFTTVSAELKDVNGDSLRGRRVVLNIFPSVDTGVCAASEREFNKRAAGLENTAVVSVSKDLPFALGRFCAAEGIENVEATSAFRSSFGEDFGVTLTDSPLAGLLGRAVLVLDAEGTVLHSQLVPEITTEPDYDAALAVLN